MADSPQTKARKSSAFRWAVAGVAILALVVVGWLIFGARGTVEELVTPPPAESGGYGAGQGGQGVNQPPAVTPNQDSSGTPAAPPPQPAEGADGTTQ